MATIPIYNPAVPFLGQIPGGLRPSLMVRLKGRIHGHGWCQINFVNSPALNCNQDVIFHISIRPNDKVIVRNTFKNGAWQEEERYGLCRIKRDETFEIILLAEHEHYKIAVNGHHLGVFRHRLPLSMVNYINVSGETTLDHILLEQDSRSAQTSAIISQVTSHQAIATPRMPINMPPHFQAQNPTIQVHQYMQPSFPGQVHAQPSFPGQVHAQPSFPGQVHTQMHVQQQHNPSAPPPPYYPSLPHSTTTTITRIGGITIEQRPGAVVVKQRNHRSNVFRF